LENNDVATTATTTGTTKQPPFIDISTPRPLNHNWSVYINEDVTNLNHTSSLDSNQQHLYDTFFQLDTLVDHVSTVQGFWSVWNALNVPSSQRSQHFAIKFFKNGINEMARSDHDFVSTPSSPFFTQEQKKQSIPPPNYNHPIVKPGGRWSLFSYDKSKRAQIWTELLFGAIGENDYFWRRTFDVQGIIFQSHQTYDSIQIWNGIPQMAPQTAQKMMKRLSSLIKHVEDHDGVPIAHIGEDVFLEYYKSHFGREFSYNSSRGGSGHSSPASRSGYSTPTLQLRKNSMNRTPQTAQYSPRASHTSFHHKLRQKLQQRFPESSQQSVSTPPSATVSDAPVVVEKPNSKHIQFEDEKNTADISTPEKRSFESRHLNLLIIVLGCLVAFMAVLILHTNN